MKKSLWWVMLAAATVSCSEIDPQIPSSGAAGESSSFSVPIDLARHFAKVSNDDNPLVSEFPFVDGRDTLCYVFNYERGWAIVAADRRVTPVIAYDEQGNMPPSLRLNTPFFGPTVGEQLSYIKLLKSGAVTEYDSSNLTVWRNVERLFGKGRHTKTIEWSEDTYYEGEVWREVMVSYEDERVALESTGHLITTKWGQGSPWNTGFPVDGTKVCPTGCVAVAVSQMLKYLHDNIGKPSGLYHAANITGRNGSTDISLSDYVEDSPRWSLMPVNRYSDSTRIGYARNLMLDVGKHFGIEYGADASGAHVSTDKFAKYGLSCTEAKYNADTIKASILSGMPVVVTAYLNKKSNWFKTVYSGGHCWIMDGWCKERLIHHVYFRLEKLDITLDDYEWLRDDSHEYYLPEEMYSFYPEGQVYDGAIVHDVSYSDFECCLMNWGYDGFYDSTKYYVHDKAEWTTPDGNYQHKRRFYYGFN